MKKEGIRANSNLVKSFWQSMYIDGRIIALALDFRLKIGMPEKGFATTEEWERWRKETEEKYGTDQTRIDNFNEFEKEVKEIYPHIGVLSDMGFRQLLIIYFIYNSLENEDFEKIRFSEFDVITVKNHQPVLYLKEKLQDGVYIKIGPKTSIIQFKNYLNMNSKWIKAVQKHFLEMTKPPLVKHVKSHPNFGRDNMIVWLNRLSKKELEEDMGGFGNTKEAVIASIIRDITKKKIINSGIVKTVLLRRRRAVKELNSRS